MANTKSNDLLIEIGTEELPARGLDALSQAFTQRIASGLEKAELSFTQIKSFCSPRRLAVLIYELTPFQPDRVNTKRGPAKTQAYDASGAPTEILKRFAEASGVGVDQLTLHETPKGAWIVLEQKETGKTAEALIPNIVREALQTLPLPKRMRWNSSDESFIRPVHWVVLMLANKVLPATYFNIPSDSKTRGHRFHCLPPITIDSPQQYEALLHSPGFVVADFQKRKTDIRNQLLQAASKQNAIPILEEDLLEEVTGLVEWPVVMLGKFSAEFLELPREVLITSMQVHQKCFAVEDTKTKKLLPYFLITSNIASIDPTCVIHGNECVMSARLSDAAFYKVFDQKISLRDRRENLKQVIFQQGLGSLWDKCLRISELSAHIAPLIHANPTDTQRASQLCKTDLLTQMVKEFPELQGVMGKYYALHDKESEAVAIAIEEHYHPRFAEDSLPTTPEGIALALADRIDTLVGLFGLGKRATGDKDPFALRRQALGVLRILIEKHLDLDLLQLLKFTQQQYSQQNVTLPSPGFIEALMDFCYERLRAWTTESNISSRVFDAVLENRPTSPDDFNRRLLAVNSFRMMPEAESLAQANKRVKNILAKTEPLTGEVEIKLIKEAAEKSLLAALINKEAEIAPFMQQKQYENALRSLAELKVPVDAFFDQVMVMVDDAPLRNNRLKLLNRLRALFLEIADISVL